MDATNRSAVGTAGEGVRVYVRVRPPLPREFKVGECVQVLDVSSGHPTEASM